MDPVVALFINKNDFQQFCRQNPDVALKVLVVVGRRLRQLVGLVELRANPAQPLSPKGGPPPSRAKRDLG
jgi:CRP-like cAMP-binding protein